MSNHVLSEACVYPRGPRRKIDPFCCLWSANLPAKTWKVEMFGDGPDGWMCLLHYSERTLFPLKQRPRRSPAMFRVLNYLPEEMSWKEKTLSLSLPDGVPGLLGKMN